MEEATWEGKAKERARARAWAKSQRGKEKDMESTPKSQRGKEKEREDPTIPLRTTGIPRHRRPDLRVWSLLAQIVSLLVVKISQRFRLLVAKIVLSPLLRKVKIGLWLLLLWINLRGRPLRCDLPFRDHPRRRLQVLRVLANQHQQVRLQLVRRVPANQHQRW